LSPTSPQAHSRGAATRAARLAGEIAALAAPLALLLWTLRAHLRSLDRGLWGPAEPWGNGDFIGNFWCWWREAELQRRGVEWLDTTGWPGGGGVLDQLFPNRLDAWLALPAWSLEGWWWTWNTMAVILLVLAVVVVVRTARSAGASPAAAATAGLVLAMSPTLFHELGWGRMAGFVLVPGLLALAACAGAARQQRRNWSNSLAAAAGALLVLQAVAYPFHGLAAGLACCGVLLGAPLPWRRRGLSIAALLGTATIVGLPWLLAKAGDFSALAGSPPPAGYTSLPAAGLLGLSSVPERFRLLPMALPLGLLALGSRRSRPWALAGLAVLLLAMGPRLIWRPGSAGIPSPTSLLMAASSWLARMHHPVRAAPIGLAALGVAVALLLDPAQRQLRWLRAGGLLSLWVAAVLSAGAVARATSFDQPVQPPGADAARWLGNHGEGPVADLLSGQHMVGVALQPWHRRPLLETVQGWGPASGGSWSPDQQHAADAIAELAEGYEPGPRVLRLQDFGVRHIILVDRRGQWTQAPDPEPAATALEALLGPPDYRDDEARVWTLTPTRPR
jgi:hypothetical protein